MADPLLSFKGFVVAFRGIGKRIMKTIASFGRRFGVHLMLAAITLILILIGRVSLTEEAAAVDAEVGGETAVSPTLNTPATLPPPVVGGSAAQSQPISALPVVSDNSLSPLPNPHTFQAQPPSHQFETYIVERGDTPNKIADQFGISAATLLGGNPWMSQESNQLQSGTEIIILPADGVLHTVKPGETVASIAADYEVSAEAIIAYVEWGSAGHGRSDVAIQAEVLCSVERSGADHFERGHAALGEHP